MTAGPTGREGGTITLKRGLLLTILIAIGFAGGVSYGHQGGGVKQTLLQTFDPPQGYQTIFGIAELVPGVSAGRHTNPGAEVACVLEGEITVAIDGKPEQRFKVGDSLMVPAGVVDDGPTIGDKPSKVLGS